MNTIIKTLKLRIKDKHCAMLNKKAFEVNQVWNAVNEETSIWQYIPVPEVGYVYTNISVFELQKQLKTIRQERDLSIMSATVQETIAVHGKARKQFKKRKLRWRVSGGPLRSLGWVPFKIGQVKWKNGQIKFNGQYLGVWDSYGLSGYDLRSGSFSQDARGRWYVNIAVQVEVGQSTGTGEIGIDLGLKTTATCSNGETLERKEYYRGQEAKLAKAQKAKNKYQIKNIHAKIKNRRMDTNHKFTSKLVKENSLIVIGDVSSSKLAKTNMAKSIYDAGWYQLKTQLDYKSKAMQVMFMIVNEANTTQICSNCGDKPDSRPKGIAGLGIREWTCTTCGVLHDRDINASKNILALGHGRLAEEILIP